MRRSVVEGICQIAECSGRDEAENCDADTEPTRDRGKEEPPEERVAQNMRQIGVKRERGDQAPPLSFEDECGLALADVREIEPMARML